LADCQTDKLSNCQIANTFMIGDVTDADFTRNRVLSGTSSFEKKKKKSAFL